MGWRPYRLIVPPSLLSFPVVDRRRCAIDHSYPLGAEIQNEWSYTSTPLTPVSLRLIHSDALNFAVLWTWWINRITGCRLIKKNLQAGSVWTVALESFSQLQNVLALLSLCMTVRKNVWKLIGNGFKNIRHKFGVWYAARSFAREVKIDEKANACVIGVCEVLCRAD